MGTMLRLEKHFADLKQLDQLACHDSPVHRLDPRAKLITVLVFLVCLLSFDRYEVAALLPYLFFPLAIAARGNVSLAHIYPRLLLFLPFALLAGGLNPLFDRQVIVTIGAVPISGGWLSCISILLRFVLTLGVALLLIATTGFNDICASLERLGMPRPFAVQLLFLYRYIFVLGEEGLRMVRAWELRALHGGNMKVKVFGSLVGHLLLRTFDRARRIHLAMLSRGFHGGFHVHKRQEFGRREAGYAAGWSLFFVACRLWNLPSLVGSIITGGLP
ncbi:cobalt ECF transporter T component CbiQ [Geotalea toluenoxydans]